MSQQAPTSTVMASCAPNEERHQREVGPVVGLRDAGLHLHQAVDRNGGAGEIERNDGVGVEMRRQQRHDAGADDADDAGDRRTPATRCRLRKPRSRSGWSSSVYSGMKRRAAEERPTSDSGADHQHPGPDIDENAELEAAHEAREQHLRDQRQQRRADAHQEHLAGDELRQPVVALVGEDRFEACVETRDRPGRRGILGTGLGCVIAARRRPRYVGRHGHPICVARNR